MAMGDDPLDRTHRQGHQPTGDDPLDRDRHAHEVQKAVAIKMAAARGPSAPQPRVILHPVDQPYPVQVIPGAPIDTLESLRDLYATDQIDELELETRTEVVLKREQIK